MQPAARFVSLACWHAGGVASLSRNALPVLEEWHDAVVRGGRPYDRPRMCGVAGCAEPLVKDYHQRYRLCPAHMNCSAVLRGGVPQRWCPRCCKFHALKAFGSRRYAPTSRSECCANPQTKSPLQKCMPVHSMQQDAPGRLSRAPCCVQDAPIRKGAHTGFLSDALRTCGRSCKAGLEARREYDMRKGRARPAGAAAAGPAGRSSAARPAAAPAAGAAPAAARTAAPVQSSQDVSLEVQRARAEDDAAAAPAHPADEREAARLSSPAARARKAAAAAAAGAASARSAEQRESAPMWLLAERARDGRNPAAGRFRQRTTGEDDVGMSDGSLAPSTFDSASEPDGAPGDGPHGGGACCLSLTVLLVSERCEAPTHCVFSLLQCRCEFSLSASCCAGLRQR